MPVVESMMMGMALKEIMLSSSAAVGSFECFCPFFCTLGRLMSEQKQKKSIEAMNDFDENDDDYRIVC